MQFRHSKSWLWLLATTLLLMQSIAVWHDAEHAYHDRVALCDQLNVISHTPSIDAQHQLNVSSDYQYVQYRVLPKRLVSFDNTYHSFAIRAPPLLIA